MKNAHSKSYMPFTKAIHNILLEYNIPQLNIIKYENPLREPWAIYKPPICTDKIGSKKSGLPPSAMLQYFSEHLQQHNDSIKIYTDGSKSSSGVGFGIITPSSSIKGKLSLCSSIFSAEVSAVQHALHSIVPLKNKTSTIFTDSMSTLESIKALKPSHPLSSKIQQTAHTLSLKGHKVEFCWCPSHVGINGNEAADSLAKCAAQEDRQRIEKTYHKDFKKLFKEKIIAKWQLEWTNHINNMAEHDVLEQIKPNISSWNSAFLPSRFEEVLLCRLRLGHTRLTHGYLMAQSPRSLCDRCDVPITIPHLLINCPKFSLPRKVFGNNPNLNTILHEESINFKNILQFLKRVNVLKDI